jgi:hypothetical protein
VFLRPVRGVRLVLAQVEPSAPSSD